VIEGARRPLTPTEISDAMHLTSGSMTSLLDTLERRGLIRRLAHDDDRRKVLIEVTPDGEEVLDQTLPTIQILARTLLEDLTEKEQETLLRLLRKVQAACVETEDVPPVPGRRQPPWREARADPM
jgi:DNA-binding MarR family transcriptional regulator